MPGSPWRLPLGCWCVPSRPAGWQKIFHGDVQIGFVAHAQKFQAAIDQGLVLAPAKNMFEMERIVFNDYVDAALAGLFMLVVLSVLVFGVRTVLAARRSGAPSGQESPFVAMPAPRG